MTIYVVRRLLLAIPVLVLSSLVVFGLMRVMPGDALTALMAESGNVSERELQKLRKDLKLDLPYHEQYLHWVWQMVTFNPGRSVFTGDAIAVSLKRSIPVTIELAAMAMVFGVALAIPLGVLSATRQDKLSDYIGRLIAISGLSFPDFWLGTLIITFAAIWFAWIPPLGYTSLWESPWKNLQQFLLPAAVLGLRLSAATMRMTRSTLLEVLREDYVRTAWAKGLGEWLIIYKHALKNALIPVVTIVGGQLGTLLAGTVIVETIFALPGMGRLTVEAILFRDYPVVQTNVMLVAATLVTLNLLVDLTYAWLDPRIRYQ
jgi:peptide/nickel transport system permease protein